MTPESATNPVAELTMFIHSTSQPLGSCGGQKENLSQRELPTIQSRTLSLCTGTGTYSATSKQACPPFVCGSVA